jgi:hypothetical protein
MIERLTFGMFCDRFHQMGRGDQFSYQALQLLWEHIEELEESQGSDIELDVVALCCDWTEYASVGEAAVEVLGMSKDEVEDAEADQLLEQLNDRGYVLCGEGGSPVLVTQ